MAAYDDLKQQLKERESTWLVTGGGGFIGSHITETLLNHGQRVVVVDNFSTSSRSNLEAVQTAIGDDLVDRLQIIEADLCDVDVCHKACQGVDYVLHQAALGSVPRSIDDPISSHAANVTATVNLFTAAKDAGVKRVVYASSSSVYGDEPNLPKVENQTGELLSPYAATKAICETYAGVFARCYGLETIGLRYFNVFGPRQDPDGPYAAVIPKWIDEMRSGRAVTINGDGSTSRDFTYVDNAVQANLLAAATVQSPDAVNRAYNVAVAARTTLTELADAIAVGLRKFDSEIEVVPPIYGEFRDGDVLHSLADISEAGNRLGYQPEVDLSCGLDTTIAWFAEVNAD